MNLADVNFLNQLIAFFEKRSIQGLLTLYPSLVGLIGVFGIIDLCTTWTLYSGDVRLSKIISRIIKISAFIFLLNYWCHPLPGISLGTSKSPATIPNVIMTSFKWLGSVASGATTNPAIYENQSPSGILNRSFDVCTNLLSDIKNIGFTTNGGLGKIISYLLGSLLIIFSSFFIAFQLTMTLIEFYVFCTIGAILLPFGNLKLTSSLFQKVFSGLFNVSIKIMVIMFILGLVETNIADAKAIPLDADLSTILKQGLSMASLGFLTWQLPQLAASQLSGSFDMNGGAIATGGMKAAGHAASKVMPGAKTAGIAAGSVLAMKEAMAASAENYKRSGAFSSQNGAMGAAFGTAASGAKAAGLSVIKGTTRTVQSEAKKSSLYKNFKTGYDNTKPTSKNKS